VQERHKLQVGESQLATVAWDLGSTHELAGVALDQLLSGAVAVEAGRPWLPGGRRWLAATPGCRDHDARFTYGLLSTTGEQEPQQVQLSPAEQAPPCSYAPIKPDLRERSELALTMRLDQFGGSRHDSFSFWINLR
jgi:hypothetical protein